jgi:V/A-type H+-transporting ATPase subunit C
MSVSRYGFVNAKLRSRMGKIISQDVIDRMVRSGSLSEAIQILRGTPFEVLDAVFGETGDLKMAELALFEEEVRLHMEVEGFVKGRIRLYVVSMSAVYEIENLKNALRLWFDRTVRGRSIGHLAGYLSRQRIQYEIETDAIINAGDGNGVVVALMGTPYAPIVKENMSEVERKRSLFPVEVALDQHYYEQLLLGATKLGSKDRSIAERIVGVEIDINNINRMVRLRESFSLSAEEAARYVIPNGYHLDGEALYASYSRPEGLLSVMLKGYGSLQGLMGAEPSSGASGLLLIERILGEIVLQEARKTLMGYPFTIGVVLVYFLLKRQEMQRIMTVLNAKQYGLSADRTAALI